MTAIAHPIPAPRPRRTHGCSRCGQPRAAQIVLSARPVRPRCRPLAAASAHGLCELCALDVFTALEHELERQLGAPRRALDPHETEDHDD